MGKRKLHGATYFQCDWTGLPMRASLCYMPVFTESGKMTKHGSYVCWEAVIAHAEEQFTKDCIDKDTRDKIQAHVDSLVGCTVAAAPHWSRLAWFSGDAWCASLNADQFFTECVALDSGDKTAVIMRATGEIGEIEADSTDQRLKFGTYLGVRTDDVHSFVSTRKKARDREIVVFYTVDTTKPYNDKASLTFKMKLHGDVIVAQQTKETCYWPRTRYCDYTLDKFNSEKRKREDTSGLSKAEYTAVRAQMEQELSAFEGAASSLSVAPTDLARASVIVPPDAKELAALKDPAGLKRLEVQLKDEKQARKMALLEARLTNASQPVAVAA